MRNNWHSCEWCRQCMYHPAGDCSSSVFIRSFGICLDCCCFLFLLQASHSRNPSIHIRLFLHNHIHSVNSYGSGHSLFLQMIKPCQNTTVETLNTKQGQAAFTFCFFAQIFKYENCWGGKKGRKTGRFSSLSLFFYAAITTAFYACPFRRKKRERTKWDGEKRW